MYPSLPPSKSLRRKTSFLITYRIKLGVPIQITYITPTGAPATLTADASLSAGASISSPSVSHGKLDVLFIPGPDPSSVPDEESKSFIRAHAAEEKTSVMIICTGILPAGYSGILKGKTVTGKSLASSLARS